MKNVEILPSLKARKKWNKDRRKDAFFEGFRKLVILSRAL